MTSHEPGRLFRQRRANKAAQAQRQAEHERRVAEDRAAEQAARRNGNWVLARLRPDDF